MATKPNEGVAHGCGQDCLTKTLGRFGICRSLLITLALLPFSWEGVVWCVDTVKSIFDLVTEVGG